MELLQHPEDRGYPAEYLCSRIRGRRSRLIADWKRLIFDVNPSEYLAAGNYGRVIKERSSAGVWRGLAQEYQWVFSQMNEQLRDIFNPFFIYAELRTLFICLRHKKDRKAGGILELLEKSLLSNGVKKVLAESIDVPEALDGLENIFLERSARFAGLKKRYETDGLRSVEQHLTNTFLAVTVRDGLHPLVKKFFQQVIDSRNIMSLYKYLRFDSSGKPFFIEGGCVPLAQLNVILDRKDLVALAALVTGHTGIKVETPDPTQVEVALYKSITRFLKKAGRDPLGIGLFLDYLWKCSIEAMNLSIVLSSRDLEREAVSAELVM